MSEFKKEGFLSTEMVEYSKKCREYYSEWFTLCESINKFSIALTSKVAYHPDNRQEWLTAALFLRTLRIFEGTIILTERCMLNEAMILLRTLMETLFALGAVAKNTDMAEEYYQNHLFAQLRAAKSLKSYYDTHNQTQEQEKLDIRIEELKTQIGQSRVINRDTKYWANKAGLDDYYNTAYVSLSWAVHSNVMDVAHKHVVGESDDYVDSVYLSFQIDDSDFGKLFLSVSECMVIALQSVNALFKAGVGNEIADYNRHYKSLFTSYKEVNSG